MEEHPFRTRVTLTPVREEEVQDEVREEGDFPRGKDEAQDKDEVKDEVYAL